ncbi:TetR/AcrR family transcriptional regulator C-terminal domain-containing protein [Streptomyces sp. NPDC004579]|uniref:TetR/AcrR family transcriptional regulator n=1 Tax=Streptomyces sp. NPDC004579 TaxID=3154667 RepID=UPI0033A64045
MVGAADRAKRLAGLDRERVTAAAVRLLDAEGPARFSMRRLAAELNVTAMSVYWYVDTKDELLELALDAVFGELELPEPEAEADWRDRLRGLATGYRAMLGRHPWVSALIGNPVDVGPCSAAFSECVRRVAADTGIPPYGQVGAVSAVFQFVYGGQFAGAESGERDSEFALDLLIAGIEAMAARSGR